MVTSLQSFVKSKLSRIALVRRWYLAYQTLYARSIVAKVVWEKTSGLVASGPFRGMVWGSSGLSWASGDLAPQLLGIYEQELHDIIEFEARRQPSQIINLGCADGYYTVGLARMTPSSEVWGIDINPKSLAICARYSMENNVVVKLSQKLPLDLKSGGFWLIDVEGAEEEFVHPELFPVLTNCSILVELHPWVNPHIREELLERLGQSHEAIEIQSGGRDPNQFQFLRTLPDTLRWSVVSEGRPEAMSWLYFVPRGVESITNSTH